MSPLLRDRLGSLFMLAFIASLWVQRDYMSPFGGLFPDTIMILMLVFVGLSVVLSFVRGTSAPAGGRAPEGSTARIDYPSLRRVLVVVVLLALWVGLYRPAGFALTGTLGFAGIAWYLGEHRRAGADAIRALVAGAVVTFVVYLVFDYFLQVPLPAGFLFE